MEKDQLRGVVNLLVYAKTEMEYMKRFRYMKHLSSIGYVVSSHGGLRVASRFDSVSIDNCVLATVGSQSLSRGHLGSWGSNQLTILTMNWMHA